MKVILFFIQTNLIFDIFKKKENEKIRFFDEFIGFSFYRHSVEQYFYLWQYYSNGKKN